MPRHTILVLASATVPELAVLNDLPGEPRIVIGGAEDAFANDAAEATVLFQWSGSPALLQAVFRKCPKLQWLHARSAGLEKVLFPELVSSPVVLTNGSGVFSAALAEFAIAAILFFAKDLRRMVRNQEKHVWERFTVEPVAGKTLGIVGYGDIGRAVALRARSLGMKVLAVRRHAGAADDLAQQVFGRDGLLEVIHRSDYLALCTPLTPETHGLIGEAELTAAKPSLVLINIGRGPVVNEAALVAALREQRIRGAALDVFDQEPLPAEHPYYELPNLLLSPHCADHTPDWLQRAAAFFVEQFTRFAQGAPLMNVVNKELGY